MMINRIISLIFVLAFLGGGNSCNIHDPEVITISDACPIQFWVNGVETYNQKQVCSIAPICFCQKFNCGDDIRIQFTETDDSDNTNYDLVIYNDVGVEIGRMRFSEIADEIYQLEFKFGTGICDQQVKLTIESSVMAPPFTSFGQLAGTGTWSATLATISFTYTGAMPYTSRKVYFPFNAPAGNYTLNSALDSITGISDGFAYAYLLDSAFNILATSAAANLANADFPTGSMVSASAISYIAFDFNNPTSGSNPHTLSFHFTIASNQNWVSSTSPSARIWLSVAYGNGLFVAVAQDGTTANQIMTSSDRITWTSRTSPSARQWYSVTYGNGLFVAVAEDGTTVNQIMTSADGITWTSRTSPSAQVWLSVIYGNGLFVAVSYDGAVGVQVMTSPDGIVWTSRTSPSARHWRSITYGNGLFVVVADDGAVGVQIMTSADGVTWTSRTSASARIWHGVTYGNGLFVAVAYDGAVGNQIMTSPDGITWTSRISPSARQWESITYGNGFVAVSADGAVGVQIMTSPDGITWTSKTSPSAQQWHGITYGNGLFVAVAQDGAVGVQIMINFIIIPDAQSDCISLKTSHECTELITYSNSKNFAGLDYADASPSTDFNIRVDAVFFEESFPEEFEEIDLSNSSMVQLRSEVKHKKILDLGRMPFYMHKKLILVLAHDSVIIDGTSWMKTDGYQIATANKNYPLRRAQVLLTDKDYIQRNVL